MAEYDKTITEAIAKIEEGFRMLSGGPMRFYLEQLIKRSDLLFSRFCPFQKGDKVRLIARLNNNKDAWNGIPYLVPGARGVIQEVGLGGNGKFKFHVTFDDEPGEEKRTYCIGESDLAREPQ